VPTFPAGKPKVLFEKKYQTGYDVAPDGKRFLMVKAANPGKRRRINYTSS
jgi:hypothetical protein